MARSEVRAARPVQTATPVAGRRVLIVSMYYEPEASGSAPYTTDLAQHLVERGAQVDVVTTHPHYPEWRRSRDVRNDWVLQEHRGVQLHRVPCYVPSDPTLSRRALYESSFVAAAMRQLPTLRPDVVVGCSPALFAAGASALLARARGVPLVQWLQDVVSSAAVQSGLQTASPSTRLLTWLEAGALSSADGVALASDSFVPTVRTLTRGRVPLQVIRNWSRLPDDQSIDGTTMRQRLGWGERSVVLHTGNIGQKQGLDELIPTLRRLSIMAPELLFVFVGDGNQRHRIEHLARGLSNTQMLPAVPDEEYLPLLRAADVLLVHERSSVVDMSLPSKLTAYLAAGRPIVAVTRRDGATAKEVARCGGGIQVGHGDPVALMEAVRVLAGSEAGRRLADRGLEYYRRHLGPESGLADLELMIGTALAGRTLIPARRLPSGPVKPPLTRSATLAIPVFNEVDGISDVLGRLADQLERQPLGYTWEILVVDDGSSDGTAEVVEELAQRRRTPIRLVRHGHNQGLGAALSTLFRESRGDVVVTLDADLSYDEAHVERLVRAFEAGSASVVVASPYTFGGRTVAVPRGLEVRSRVANRYLSAVGPLSIRTFTGMVRAYEGEFVRTLPPLRSGPSANVEILLEASRRRLEVAEIPATLDWSGREDRRSRNSLISRKAITESVQVVRDGVRLRMATRGVRPLATAMPPEVVIDLTESAAEGGPWREPASQLS